MLDPNEPPEYGEIEIQVGISPVSIQAKQVKKNQIVSAIRDVTRSLNYVFLGDLQLEIDWFGAPISRFETDKSPDVDNIVKPIIDALCGLEGLLIDDCQLQAVSTYWMYEYSGVERFTIRLKYINDQWTFKKDLAFIRVKDALCLPLEMNLPTKALKLMVRGYRMGFSLRDIFIRLGVHDSYTRAILPTYRVFHRSRIKDFKVFEVAEFNKILREIKAQD